MTEKKQLYKIEIVDDATVTITSEADPNDSWDRDSTFTNHNILGFLVRPDGEKDVSYFDLMVDFEPSYDETYYLLYLIYSTGDSFGNDEQEGLLAIGLYTKDQLDIANTNMDRIQECSAFSIDLLATNGEEFTISCPWIGYFEHLDLTAIREIKRLR